MRDLQIALIWTLASVIWLIHIFKFLEAGHMKRLLVTYYAF